MPKIQEQSSVARGYLSGFTLSNNGTDANNDIDIAAGEAADDAALYMIKRSSTITKRLDASWSAGSGNGGLDTGAKAASTTYFVFVIRNPETGAVDALFSASLSPTMPSGYTSKRRVGAIITDGSANILQFTQRGDEFIWNQMVQNAATTPPTSGTLVSVTAPNGIQTFAKVWSSVFRTGGGTTHGIITSPSQPDVAPSSVNFTMRSLQSGGNYIDSMSAGVHEILTNTSRQVRARFDAADNTYWIHTIGYRDILR
jgi:hypothetical protein